MRVAICDDRLEERRRILKILKEYAADRGLALQALAFESAGEMLKEAEKKAFTHYFLDIMMPGMNGVDAAREIRGFDASAVIVFLTSFNEYAWQSYRVQASDYLLKPVDADQIFELMDRLRGAPESERDCICIENGRSYLRIPFESISHLEVSQKKLHFYLADGGIRRVQGTLRQFENDLLGRSEFVKIHRSYIVNMNQISMLSSEGCVTFTGMNLPISRLLYKQVHEAYINHLFEVQKG